MKTNLLQRPFGIFLLSVLLFAVVFVLFAPTIRHPLVDLGDHACISRNRMVNQGLAIPNVRRASTAAGWQPSLRPQFRVP